MKTSKLITVVHPDSRTRVALRSTLEAHGCTVATDRSCAGLLSGSQSRPKLILLDRSILNQEGADVLSRLHQGNDSEIVLLPEGLSNTLVPPELLRIVDRLLQMPTMREILAT